MGAEQSRSVPATSATSSNHPANDSKRPRPPRNHSSASTATLGPPRKVRLDELVADASPARHTTSFSALAEEETLSRIDQRIALPLSPLNRLKSTRTQLAPVTPLEAPASPGKGSRSGSPVRTVPRPTNITAETLDCSPEALALIHRRSLLYAASPGSQTRRPKDAASSTAASPNSSSSCALVAAAATRISKQSPIQRPPPFVIATDKAPGPRKLHRHDAASTVAASPVLPEVQGLGPGSSQLTGRPERGTTPLPIQYSLGPYRRGTLRIVNLDLAGVDETAYGESETTEAISSAVEQQASLHKDAEAQEPGTLPQTLTTVATVKTSMGASGSKEVKRPSASDSSKAQSGSQSTLQRPVKTKTATPSHADPVPTQAQTEHELANGPASSPRHKSDVQRQDSGASSVRSSVGTDYSVQRCASSCSSALSEQLPVPRPLKSALKASARTSIPRPHGKEPAEQSNATSDPVETETPSQDDAEDVQPQRKSLLEPEADLIRRMTHKPFAVSRGKGRSVEEIQRLRRRSVPTSPASTVDSLTSASTASSNSSFSQARRTRRSRISIPADYEPIGPIDPVTLVSEVKYYKTPAHHVQYTLADPDMSMQLGVPRSLEELTRRQQLIRSGSENALARIKPRGPRPVMATAQGAMQRGVSMGCLTEVGVDNRIADQRETEVQAMRSVSSGGHVKKVRIRHLAGDEDR